MSYERKPDYELLDELNRYVGKKIEPGNAESSIPVDQLTAAIAERLAKAEKQGLARILDKTFY